MIVFPLHEGSHFYAYSPLNTAWDGFQVLIYQIMTMIALDAYCKGSLQYSTSGPLAQRCTDIRQTRQARLYDLSSLPSSNSKYRRLFSVVTSAKTLYGSDKRASAPLRTEPHPDPNTLRTSLPTWTMGQILAFRSL